MNSIRLTVTMNSNNSNSYYLLESSNEYQWINNINASFHLTGTIRWASGTCLKPHASIANLTQDQLKEQNYWLDMDSKANALIYNSLSNQFRSTTYFSFEKTSSENFAALKIFIKEQSSCHGASIRRKLEEMTKKSSESILEFYNRWTQVHNQYFEATGKSCLIFGRSSFF